MVLPSPLSSSSEIVHDPVADCPDQCCRFSAVRLAGRLDGWATAADDHLEQHGPVALAGKGILRQVFEQGRQDVNKREACAQQLFDQCL